MADKIPWRSLESEFNSEMQEPVRLMIGLELGDLSFSHVDGYTHVSSESSNFSLIVNSITLLV